MEQRINIKLCEKIGKSASETWLMVNTSSVSERHRRFKGGREDVQDDPRSGQPKKRRTDANVDTVRTKGESTVLTESADSEKKTRNLA
ncbi:hypothetical protein B7P43_G15931 [Cryptotermes secundus]|uniref:Uncharacterized protein n=1 Tax=Cryptotermes secundus TaxID=105785 RepID=A0A2J7RJ40_9NEOP|nr:hypothetical protein B7P43_G15931 [Cryptotermes secundus]